MEGRILATFEEIAGWSWVAVASTLAMIGWREEARYMAKGGR